MCCLAGGLVALLIGSTATVAAWAAGQSGAGPYLQKISTALLVVALPLLMFGAHCLDLADKKNRVPDVTSHDG